LKLAILIALFVAWKSRPAEACSCGDPVPACEAFQSSPVVFVGKVVAVKESGSELEATFTVTEKLKGHVENEQVIKGGGLCGTMFQKGKTYIVYASNGSSSLCGRTATTDRAKDDLAYARGFEKRTKAVLEGIVSVEEVKRAGVEVRVRGANVKARTDKNGRYKLELPPGKYTLDVVDPKARVPADGNEVVNLAAPSTCASRNLSLVWNGRVRGKLLGPDGKPIEGAQLTLVATSTTRAGNQFTTTDAKGAYEFSGVQAGEYQIVVYTTKGVPTTTYYPGVDDATKAKAIKLSQSGVVQKIDFKLLP